MTTAQVVETSVTNNSLSEDYSHPDNHTGQTNSLTKTLHLTLKMTTTQVVEMSVTNNSLSKDYSHPDDHAKQISNESKIREA